MALCIIGAKDVSTYVKYKNAILVDLRDENDYKTYHIAGAIHIPAEQLQRFMKRTDKNRIHIFYCQHGSLSLQTGKKYAKEGYKICSLAGGIDSYVTSSRSNSEM